jgi:hypothetical protein
MPLVRVNRGEVEAARAGVDGWTEQPADAQERALYNLAQSVVLLAEGKAAEAVDAGEAAFAYRVSGSLHSWARHGFICAVEAALALEDTDRAEALLAEVRSLPPGFTPPLVRAQFARLEARLASIRGEHDLVEPSFVAAVNGLRELGFPFDLAVALVEYGEWLVERGRSADAEEPLAEARAILERLKAKPWLERLERATAAQPVVATGSD